MLYSLKGEATYGHRFCFLIVLFIALLITEIVEFFAKSDVIDGFMLFARPIVVLLLVLLDGKSFWLGLLYGLLWGFIGFVLHMLVDEHFSRDKEENNQSIEQILNNSQEAAEESMPHNNTSTAKLAVHVKRRKESQTKQPFGNIPSVSIAEVTTTETQKTNRAVPNDAPPPETTPATPLDMPPPETTPVTPLDVPPPEAETYKF